MAGPDSFAPVPLARSRRETLLRRIAEVEDERAAARSERALHEIAARLRMLHFELRMLPYG